MLRLFVCKREREGAFLPSFLFHFWSPSIHVPSPFPPSVNMAAGCTYSNPLRRSLPRRAGSGNTRNLTRDRHNNTFSSIFFTLKKSTGKCTFRGSVRLCVFSGHSSPNPVPGRHIYFETEAEAGDGSVVFFDEGGTCTPRFPANKKDDNYCNGNSPFYLHPLPAGDWQLAVGGTENLCGEARWVLRPQMWFAKGGLCLSVSH